MIYNESLYNKNWEIRRLDELGTFSRGVSKHRPRNDPILFSDGKYPFVQTGDITESGLYVVKHCSEYNEFGLSQSKLWPKGTLCITIAANIAETAILSYPACFPDSVVGIQANKEISSNLFMYYLFQYIKSSIKSKASGSIQDNINIEYLKSLEFRIPKKEGQEAIVGILFTIDEKIRINNQINDNLQQSILAIFRRWFIQFEGPFENTAKTWNKRLGRGVPTNWKVASIANNPLCRFIDAGVPVFTKKTYLATANIGGTNIIDGEDIFYKNRGPRANMHPALNSVWFAKMKNSIKHIFIPPTGQWMIDKYVLSTGFSALQCTGMSFPYIASVVMHPYFETAKDTLSHGATQQSVNEDDLESIPLLIPPNKVLENYAIVVSPMFAKMNEIIKESQLLVQLRNELLPLLMSGQAVLG